MSGLFQKEEKLYRGPVHWKKKLKLALEYLILTLWILSTLALLGWILTASFSTAKEIFSSKLLESEFHMENYVKVWVNSNVFIISFNSLFYAAVSCTLLILTCAPVAYALLRPDFMYDKLIQLSLVASTGVPVVVIVLPLFAVVVGLNIPNNVSANRATLMFLYIGIGVPYTTIFLTTSLANLSRAFEETAAVGDYPPAEIFWLIMLPMAQPGIMAVTILNFINIWNEHFIPLIFGNSDKVRSVAVGPYSMINSMKCTGDRAGMFSIAVTVFLLTFILYIFLSEEIIADVTGGGVKG